MEPGRGGPFATTRATTLAATLAFLSLGCGSGDPSPSGHPGPADAAGDTAPTDPDISADTDTDSAPDPDTDTDPDPDPDPDTDPDIEALPCEVEPTLDSLVGTYFAGSCAFSSCHSPTEKAGGLDLSTLDAYDQLVNVPATIDGSLVRVLPGDPDSSFLVQKVEGPGPDHGDMMPPGIGEPLDPECRIAMLRQWILDGAH